LYAQVSPFAFRENTSLPKADMQMPDLLIASVLTQDFCTHNTGTCKPSGHTEADEEIFSPATVLGIYTTR